MTYLWTFSALAMLFGGMRRFGLRRSAVIMVTLVLATMAALRDPDIARDFYGYRDWYEFGLEDSFLSRPPLLESLFFGASAAFSSFGAPFRSFLWCLAALSVYIKARVILLFARNHIAAAIALLAFSLTFYLLHDLTQIRTGVAVALLYAGLWERVNGRNLRFVVLVGLAAGFHTSAILALLFLLPTEGRWQPWIDRGLLTLSVALLVAELFSKPILDTIADQLAQLDTRLALYVELSRSFESDAANPFSIPALLALTASASVYIRSELARPPLSARHPERAAVLHCCRSVLAGVCILLALSTFSEISLRFYELGASFFPILIAIVFSRPRMWSSKLLLALWCASTAYVYIFRDDSLVKPYAMALS